MQLYEQYRPRKWSDLIGQKHIVAAIDRLRKRGLTKRAYWISGPSGTGKTTIAKLIADEVATEWSIEEADATELTANRVREHERDSQCIGLGQKRGRVFIVNEAHKMPQRVVTQLLNVLERLPSHVAWIFTTTTAGQQVLFDGCLDAEPLMSRCAVLTIDTSNLDVYMARRARKIARAESLDGQPLPAYVQLVKRYNGNLRRVLGEIEAGAMLSGKEKR